MLRQASRLLWTHGTEPGLKASKTYMRLLALHLTLTLIQTSHGLGGQPRHPQQHRAQHAAAALPWLAAALQ